MLFDLATVCDDDFLEHATIVQTKGCHLGDHVHAVLHLPKHHVFAIEPVGRETRRNLRNSRSIRF